MCSICSEKHLRKRILKKWLATSGIKPVTIPQQRHSANSSKTWKRLPLGMKRIKSSRCSCSANSQSKYNKNIRWPTRRRAHQKKSRHTWWESTNTNSMQRRPRQFNHSTQSPPLFRRTMKQPNQQRRRQHNQRKENDSRDNASTAEKQVTAKRNVPTTWRSKLRQERRCNPEDESNRPRQTEVQSQAGLSDLWIHWPLRKRLQTTHSQRKQLRIWQDPLCHKFTRWQ